MAAYDFTKHRLFVGDDLAPAATVPLLGPAANYLLTVLRLGTGTELLAFNGRDGEWRARLEVAGKRSAALEVLERVRPQPRHPDLALLFAPLKHARLDYLVQKAVEMGVGELRPVLTRRTVPGRVNLERMRANVVEAAEQCGILSVAAVHPPADLGAALDALAADRPLVFCDEDAPIANPLDALRELAGRPGSAPALLIGPEGGFDPDERATLMRRPAICRLSLGPRILRADTAIVAALAVLQATLGDWVRPASLQGHDTGPM